MDIVDSEVLARIKQEEGCIPHMYLDTRGFVTVGVGHMLPDQAAACKLPFVLRGSHLPASEQAIIDEFETIQSQQIGLRASAYLPFTRLELTDDAIDAQLQAHLQYFTQGLTETFSHFNDFPVPARLALLDMSFNLGLNGLTKKFPKLMASVEQGDWQTCAQECRRRGIGDARNASTRELFRQAADQHQV